VFIDRANKDACLLAYTATALVVKLSAQTENDSRIHVTRLGQQEAQLLQRPRDAPCRRKFSVTRGHSKLYRRV